jgi:DNA-binding CsgD family transcriptional regulator/PAS domain-containing protein
MEASLELFSGMVSGIYDAALDASLWSKALKDIVTRFDGGCGALLVSAQRSCQTLHASVGWDHASVASYDAYYGRIDPFASVIERMPVGHIFRCADVVAPDEQRRSEFFNDWAAPNDVGDGVFASLVHSGANVVWLGIGRGFRSGSSADTDKMDQLRLLVPHLQRALRVRSSLGAIEFRQRGALKAFDCLAHGVILLGGDGSILFANRAAMRIAAADEGLALARVGIRASLPDEDATLQGLIGRAIGKQAGAVRAGGSQALFRPSGRSPFVVRVVPAEADAEEFPTVRAVVVIVDPEREPQALGPMLRRIYGLTPAEATVACEVARGEGLQPVADAMSITLSTVRVHLQRVFEKTRTHRQAELARLLLTIEAAIEPSESLP